MKRFCARCGRQDLPVIDGLCLSCLVEERKLLELPGRISFDYCPRCGSYRLHGRWRRASSLEEAIHDVLLDSALSAATRSKYPVAIEGVNLETSPSWTTVASVHVSLEVNGVRAEQKLVVEVQAKPKVCPMCFKVAGEHYEATIQVRSAKGYLDQQDVSLLMEVLSELPEKLQEAVLDVEELREGVDIKVFTHAAARQIASRLQKALLAKTAETHKVVKRHNERRRSRLTILVRAPDAKPGDLRVLDGRLVKIEERGKGYITVRDLSTGEIIRGGASLAWRLTEPREGFIVDKYMVTCITPSGAQLMKMGGGYELIDVPPQSLWLDVKVGDVVDVVVYEGKFYVIGKSKSDDSKR